MPGPDWIPVVSQVKSLVQAVTGDVKGARKTQENFSRECPIVSQVRSVVELAAGDKEAALDTQLRCLGTVNNVADGLPVVGHVKGVIHHIAGDHKGGNRALKSATRTTVVMGTGAVAAAASGGIAAIPAGIAAGAVFDSTDSIIHHKPKGIVAAVDKIATEPNGGNFFDATIGIVGDGLTGYSGGRIGTKISNNLKSNNFKASVGDNLKLKQMEAELATKYELFESNYHPGGTMKTGQLLELGEECKTLYAEIDKMKHGTPAPAFDPKQAPSTEPFIVGQVRSTSYGCITDNEAYLADQYQGEQCKGDTDEKYAKAKNYANQQSSNKTFDKNYSTYQYITQEQLQRNIRDHNGDHNRAPQRNLKRTCQLIVGLRYLYLAMPSQFNYTGAVLMNNFHQGLLHSFGRHFDQWCRLIDMNHIIKTLEPIRQRLNGIRSAKDSSQARSQVEQLRRDLQSLPNQILSDVELALLQAQEKMLQFLSRYISYGRYLGEAINNNGQMQVFFDVGNGQVMALAVSQQLYHQTFAWDKRPVRGVITIFFMTEKEYLKRKTSKLF